MDTDKGRGQADPQERKGAHAMSNLTTRELIQGANNYNERTCHCIVCGQVLAPRQGYSAPLANNGGRNQYVCYPCYSGANNISYGAHAHANARGKQAKSGLTYSVELEMRRLRCVHARRACRRGLYRYQGLHNGYRV